MTEPTPSVPRTLQLAIQIARMIESAEIRSMEDRLSCSTNPKASAGRLSNHRRRLREQGDQSAAANPTAGRKPNGRAAS